MPRFSYPGSSEYFFFQGQYITREELGNITYGYLGSVMLIPDFILYIGGGVAAAGDILLNPIKETLVKRAMPISGAAVEVVPAQLGNTAGVIGASLLIKS